ncbi:Ger(x)C family spore germination protein [Paenibacillus antri]|uniref:Ger(X)C family spore germination protein n=1 Tax=Paenibacillus antri TaxID=2582848 RepID=A0A5R9G1Z4_9BACL|nr:Ger(x)C family spore germination protein [Paenibacillus antri]TLS48316.1 Ger(x)C family spore germination protein [Paenibacillus antri]
MSGAARWLRLLLLISFALALAGCWDQREIEERTSVVAIGVDRDETDPKLLSISVQIPIPIKIAGSSGGGGGSGDPVRVMRASGRTMIEAFNNLQRRVNQQLFYGHTRVIAIGEEMAKNGLDEVMDAFRRDPQIRRLLWPIVVKGKAVELLQTKPELEQIPTVFLMSLIENGAETGRIPDVNLGKFYINLSSNSEHPFLNYMEVGPTGVRWAGIAVFKEDKMLGTLDDQQTWSFMRIAERQNGGPIVFPHKGNEDELLSFTTDTTRVDETYRLENGRVQAKFTVYVEGDLIAKSFDTDFSGPSQIAELERGAERYLEEEARKLMDTLQNEYDADILGVGSKLRAYHPRIWREVRDADYFAEADIKVNYRVKLRRTGMEME